MAQPEEKQPVKKNPNYALVNSQASNMNSEDRQEVLDLVTSAVEKWPAAAERAACTHAIKEGLDKRFLPPWHVVVGSSFAYDVTHECLVHVYVNPSTSVLVWKL